MHNAIRFVKHFIGYMRDYDSYMWFKNNRMTKEQIAAAEKADAERGVKAHDKNRFDYAWNLTKIWWEHRDRYSKKCTGDCEECNCKHC